ncbi:MAG: G5 domain-containing protein, partial [Coriobacteriales bacterium]|nr:G5 domain-containing protein [Coriobacteriales bacterium]
AITMTQTDPTGPAGTRKVEQRAVDGRKIVIHYYVQALDGKVLHDINFTSYYSAQNEIVTIGTMGENPTPDPATPAAPAA